MSNKEFRGIELIQSQFKGMDIAQAKEMQDDLDTMMQWHVIGNANEIVEAMTANASDYYDAFYNVEEEINIDMSDDPDYEIEYKEPLGFWVVSDWLATRLRKCKEIVVDIGGVSVWGRCSSGQAICMDYVFIKAVTYDFANQGE